MPTCIALRLGIEPALVIYELPTAWDPGWTISANARSPREVSSDVTAPIDRNAGGENFAGLAVVQPGRSYLSELGVTALELLPAADSF